MGNMKELKEMKEKVRKNNKGFSLVELIIVIAIMAILVGIIGSQLVPYLNRSREAKDRATLDTIYTAYQTALAENNIDATMTDIEGLAGLKALSTNLGTSMENLLGENMNTDSEIDGKFRSDGGNAGAKGDIVLFTFDKSSGLIQVEKGSLVVNNQ